MNTRRRGEELETAILAAAEDLMLHEGYGKFTFDALAKKAHTSKTVIYRRWPDKGELIIAVLQRIIYRQNSNFKTPQTASLETDLKEFLYTVNRQRTNSSRSKILQLMLKYHEETGIPISEIRKKKFAGEEKINSILKEILANAVTRGELKQANFSPQLNSLPFDLARGLSTKNFSALTKVEIDRMVEEVVLPLYLLVGNK